MGPHGPFGLAPYHFPLCLGENALENASHAPETDGRRDSLGIKTQGTKALLKSRIKRDPARSLSLVLMMNMEILGKVIV